jgi:hypothetical protein
MATGSINYFSDLFKTYDVVQSTHSAEIKQLIIAQLRDYFSRDSFYHYVADEYGFPKVVPVENLPLESGIDDDLTTRIYIGEYYKADVIFYPAALVKSGNIKYAPMSLNRERESVNYETIRVYDGYGSYIEVETPKSFVFSGFWDGDISIDVFTKGIHSRDEIVNLIMLMCADIRFRDLERSGVVIKSVSASSPAEIEDRNDKIYRQTISLNVLSQWRREIPINNVCEIINVCVDFAHNIDTANPVVAPNLTINEKFSILDVMQEV